MASTRWPPSSRSTISRCRIVRSLRSTDRSLAVPVGRLHNLSDAGELILEASHALGFGRTGSSDVHQPHDESELRGSRPRSGLTVTRAGTTARRDRAERRVNVSGVSVEERCSKMPIEGGCVGGMRQLVQLGHHRRRPRFWPSELGCRARRHFDDPPVLVQRRQHDPFGIDLTGPEAQFGGLGRRVTPSRPPERRRPSPCGEGEPCRARGSSNRRRRTPPGANRSTLPSTEEMKPARMPSITAVATDCTSSSMKSVIRQPCTSSARRPTHLGEGVVARGDRPRARVDRQEADGRGVEVVSAADLGFVGTAQSLHVQSLV